MRGNHFDLLRARLAAGQGPRYWRSLEELADSEEFRQFLESEFVDEAPALADPLSRRQVLGLMVASLALTGLTGCSPPGAGRPGFLPESSWKIVPYVRAPEEIVPGKPLFFATAMTVGGYAKGLLVESHMGRPTKAEGNPGPPGSLGATDVFGQASLLTLYDPDRAHVVSRRGHVNTWLAFVGVLNEVREQQRGKRGAGLRILTETITSPSLAGQIHGVLTDFPAAKWHQYEPVGRECARAGALQAFGEDVNPIYHLEKADVILVIGCDLVGEGPGSLRY